MTATNEARDEAHREYLESMVLRRLLKLLQQRQDISNVALMASAGFCRNCLVDWLVEASIETPAPLTTEEARHLVYGEAYAAFKARQLDEELVELHRLEHEAAAAACDGRDALEDQLDDELDDGFPASDPPSLTSPR